MRYEWVPLTEEELWRNAGLGDVLDAAALGDPMASLLFRRLQVAQAAMQPEIDRLKAEMEHDIMTRGSGGLSLLTGD